MKPKQAYEEQLQYQLDNWVRRIDEIKLKAAKAQTWKRVDFFEVVEDLQGKQTRASDRLRELRYAEEKDWEEAKTVLEEAFFKLGGALNSAVKRFA